MRLANLARYAKTPADVIRFIFHLPKLVLLIHRLLNDKRVPFFTKLIPLGALLYVVMPFDILKDFSLALGYVDDVVVVYILMKTFIKACPPEVVEEHVAQLSMRPGNKEKKTSKE